MTVFYEWDVEEVANESHISIGGQEYDEGDVIEHYFQLSLKGAHEFVEQYYSGDNGLTRLDTVLVRDDDKGRSWAYLDDNGLLPEYFCNAWGHPVTKVPKRFHEEVKRNMKDV